MFHSETYDVLISIYCVRVSDPLSDDDQYLTKLVSENICLLMVCVYDKQADSEIHEDQLLNFLANRLDESFSQPCEQR